MKLINSLALGACALLLVACNGGSSSGSDSTPVSGLSDIVGMYDWSVTRDDGTVDEWYIQIDSSGYVSDYDYQGDSYDNGANCYVIVRNWDKFTYISGNRFSTLSDGDVEIFSDGTGLQIQFSDGYIEYFGSKVNIAVSTFEAAECSDSASSSSGRSNVFSMEKNNRWKNAL